MSIKDIFGKFNKKKPEKEILDDIDIENNEFYIDEPSKKKNILESINKKYLIIGAIIILVLIIGIIIFNKIPKDGTPLFDLGNLLNQEAVEKDEEQQGIHSLILRNSAWGSLMDDVAIEEKGNLIDYGDDYLTCDYETLFGRTWLPTYLFQDNKLVGIVYEANLSIENLDELSSIHQDVAVNIHYVYEQLYRENNKWATGQDRKYDKNLWTRALLNGKLTMQSVWNSSNEKVFLVTNNKSLFGFLEKQKGEPQKASMAFIIVSDEFLLKNEFEVLMDIKPSSGTAGSYNVNGENIDMTTPDEVNPNSSVGATTNYTGTGTSEGLSDEEFEAIYNEINGANGTNPEGTSGGTTMNPIGQDGSNGSSISNTQQNGTNGTNSNNSNGTNGTTGNSSNNNISGTSGSNPQGTSGSNGSNTNGTGGSGNNNESKNPNVGDDGTGGDMYYQGDDNFEKLPENSVPVTETPVPSYETPNISYYN